MKTNEINNIYNLIILDESGSMEPIKHAIIQGFNELVQNIKGIEQKFPEQKHFISFITFNGIGITTHLHMEEVSKLKQIDENLYKPNSLTPLFDAIGISILKLKTDLKSQPNSNVLVTILTDGLENDSKEFNSTQISELIGKYQSLGWTFTYIGANHDVDKSAGSISITNTLTFTANENSVKSMFIKENKAREQYNQRIHNKKEDGRDYYKN